MTPADFSDTAIEKLSGPHAGVATSRMRVHFSSTTDDWATPPDLFQKLDARWRFTLDVCANAENAKVPLFFTREQDGLAQSWAGNACWMNPPYGRAIGGWVAKAVSESRLPGTIVVALLPARTDTRWWSNWVAPFARVAFLRGRLKFGGAKSGAPFPSVIAVYPKRAKPKRTQLQLFTGGAK